MCLQVTENGDCVEIQNNTRIVHLELLYFTETKNQNDEINSNQPASKLNGMLEYGRTVCMGRALSKCGVFTI